METMIARHRRVAVLAALLLVTLPLSRTARADATPEQVEEARKHYDAGLQLTREESYDAALAEFERAYQIAPNYRILYSIGGLRRQLNDFVGALDAFEKYLSDGGASVDAKRFAEVQQDVLALRGRIGRVRIEADVEDVEIRVDGVAVGKTPLRDPLRLNPGRRKIEGIKTGFFPATSVTTVSGGETGSVKLTMTKLSDAPPSSNVPAPVVDKAALTPERAASPFKTPAIIGWVVTGGLAATAAVTGVLALGASSDLKDERTSATPSRSTLDSNESKTKTLALVSDIFTVGSVVAAGVSVYFTVRWLGGSSSPPTTVGVGPGNISLGRAW